MNPARGCRRYGYLVLACFGVLARPLPALTQDLITQGTDPGAATELRSAGNDADWRSQTFVAIGPYLRSLSIWFYGGTSSLPELSFYSRLYLNTGLGFFPDQAIFHQLLDQTHQGRYDFFFGALPVTPGAAYTFSIFTNHCGGDGCPVPVTGVDLDPRIEVTTGDAYAGGYLIDGYAGADLSRDVRFEATYVTPEPATVLLLATGLVLLGVVGLRRRVAGSPYPRRLSAS